MTSLENDLADKEDRLRAAVATRQEFAGQLVAAQQRELSVIAANAELAKTQVSILTSLAFKVHTYSIVLYTLHR